MRFEGEEAPEQRNNLSTSQGLPSQNPTLWDFTWFTGTIVGIEDADPKRQKRPRSNVLPSSPDSSVLTREGLKGADTLYQMRGTSRSNSFNEYPSFPGHRIDNQQGNWLMPQSMLPYIQMSTHSGEMMPKPMASLKPEAMKPKEGNCKLFGIPLVHKQGTALGRSVDLAKFNNYEELIAELDHLFDFNDDLWQEFCGMVRNIFIYTKEEVQRMNPGTLNSKGDDNSSVAEEGSDTKEVKNLQLPSDSSPEDS
ncbi:hypothetical protein K7X08_000246 [Anisodus acutangulus]|uniref:Auxin-responsive protein n=1 Tax=Anisodus acutangulus TaxID=402998 RepID=A0A9Q1M6D5_9SOLA|nr:hypothetical protein K7X08_000246 [Anisodus acutangulus]